MPIYDAEFIKVSVCRFIGASGTVKIMPPFPYGDKSELPTTFIAATLA